MQTKSQFKYYLFTLKHIYKIVTQNFVCSFRILANLYSELHIQYRSEKWDFLVRNSVNTFLVCRERI
jgi:hypothetical protein